MANVITTLTARIEDYRTTNKNPCKNYGTQAAAEKATKAMALAAAAHFTKPGHEVREADYVVFQVEGWGRWVGCISLSELLGRSSSTGGYLGFCTGFFSY